MIRALVLLLTLAGAARAEQIVLGLSNDEVAITANFDGSDILIFGAVKRDGAVADAAPLQVIITVSGPRAPAMVRHKARRFGIWVNTNAVEIDEAPSFYAVATSAPISDVLSHTEDLRQSISTPRAIRSVGAQVDNTADYTEALIRIRAGDGLYQVLEGAMPANLIEGSYQTRIFLTRGGQVVDRYETAISVRKVGIERWLFNLAHEKPLPYGLLSLLIAVIAGWAASAAFAGLRR